MKNKHTPAPWHIKMQGDTVLAIHGKDQWENRLVETDHGVYHLSIEDARLIAAAPDLLAALEDLSSGFVMSTHRPGVTTLTPPSDLHEKLLRAGKALRKVRGL